MKLCAPVPVFGRFPLVRLTISRLKRQGVIPLIMGHEREALDIAKEFNVEFISIDNDPLGAKWNAGFMACQNYLPDGVIFMGSSDWASDEYIQSVSEALNDFAFMGMLGCHFVDVADEVRLVHWPGYQGPRRLEPIGIGRVLRSDMLTKMNWKPFNDVQQSGLDWSMYLKMIKLTNGIGLVENDPNNINLLSISTNQWINKHKFSDHWNGKLKSKHINIELLKNNFQEIFKLFNKFVHHD
jgi:hypothetical protein